MLLELTQEDIEQFEQDLINFDKNELVYAFDKVNFRDYSNVIDKYKTLYPQFIFTLTSFGISIKKGEE